MKSSNRVAWAEGMLMTPQHLQLADAYHETLLGARLASVQSACWGVSHAALNAEALSRGVVELTRFSGVLPDGTYLDLAPGSPELPPSQPLENHFSHSAQSMPIYLVLPDEKSGVDNYSENLASPTRFRRTPRTTYDLAGSPEPEEIDIALHAPALVLGNELATDATALQIFELVRDDANIPMVSEAYVPPCLRIDSAPYLPAALRRLLQAMTTRRRALVESRRERSGTEVEFRAEEVTSFLLLNAINSHLPVVQHFLTSGDFHPRELYVLLVQFAGHLSTFSTAEDPTTLPEFRFTSLSATFEELFARLMGMLNADLDERFVAIPLESDGSGLYQASFAEQAALFQCTQFVLAIKTDMHSEQSAVQIPLLSKVASWADVNNILSAATPGAQIRINRRPPSAVPIKADFLYFSIEIDNAYWRNILADRRIAVYLPPLFDPPQTTIQLIGVKGPAEKR